MSHVKSDAFVNGGLKVSVLIFLFVVVARCGWLFVYHCRSFDTDSHTMSAFRVGVCRLAVYPRPRWKERTWIKNRKNHVELSYVIIRNHDNENGYPFVVRFSFFFMLRRNIHLILSLSLVHSLCVLCATDGIFCSVWKYGNSTYTTLNPNTTHTYTRLCRTWGKKN